MQNFTKKLCGNESKCAYYFFIKLSIRLTNKYRISCYIKKDI
jgi:hypothetical protein